MSSLNGPDEWPVVFSKNAAGCSALLGEGVDPEDRLRYTQMATDYLWNWTGRRFGTTTLMIRPCRSEIAGGVSTFFGSSSTLTSGRAPWEPVLVAGRWLNIGCGSCGLSCGCDRLTSIDLPAPVSEVVEVRVDGAVVDPDAYRVDNFRYLVRTDGGAWPFSQDLTAPDNAPGTFSVTYKRGVDVPVGGRVAAGVLACEFAKADTTPKDCALPQRLQSVARQGVTIAVLDTFDDIDEGHTGIWVIDSWVASVTKSPAPPAVYSPDVRRGPRRRTS